MEVQVAQPDPKGSGLLLVVRGLHGVRGGRFDQEVTLEVLQRELLAEALLVGTGKRLVPR